MGRNRGYLALTAGIAGGAEVVVVPEIETTPDAIAHEIRAASNRAGPIAILEMPLLLSRRAWKMGSFWPRYVQMPGSDTVRHPAGAKVGLRHNRQAIFDLSHTRCGPSGTLRFLAFRP